MIPQLEAYKQQIKTVDEKSKPHMVDSYLSTLS